MKRLSFAVLMIFLLVFATAGCGSKVDQNEHPAAKSTVVTTKADQAAAKNPAASGQEKGNKPDLSSAGKPSSVQMPLPNKGTAGTVTLMITRDFGKQVLVKKEAVLDKNSTVLDVLKANSNVSTKYDGSYVSSMQGLQSNTGGISGDNSDWFYYINGICSDAGAGDYNLKAGEHIWWDYHPWKSAGFVNSAVIGCFPEPFIHGYRGKINGAVVMASPENTALAAELEQTLKNRGAANVNRVELSNGLLEKRARPTIVIGTWPELKQLEWLHQFNNAWKKTGTGSHFTDNSLELLDYGGNAARTISGSAGIIAAAGAGLGDANPIWIIAGTDQKGLQEAVEVLTKSPAKISGMYSAAVTSGEIIRLPLQ
jgi:hypothetical protein